MRLVPNSESLREANSCHHPAGSSKGGQFCSSKGAGSPAFREWFGNSQVVNPDGSPMRMYHGTPSSGAQHSNRYVRAEQADVKFPVFDEFATDVGGSSDSGWLGRGSYFTNDPEYAWEFGDRIMPVYLSIQKPFRFTDDGSTSFANYFDFKKAVADLPGLPDDLKIRTDLPAPREYDSYRGKQTVVYDVLPLSNGTWGVLSRDPSRAPGSGVVEVDGLRSREEAIDAFHTKEKHFRVMNPDGFLLHTISKKIGSREFTDLLKKAGYDGVTDGKEWVAFYPEQIKSATGNRGTWSRRSRKITERS